MPGSVSSWGRQTSLQTLVVLILVLCLVPGCGGCRWFGEPIKAKDRKLTEEEKKQQAKQRKEKPDFEPVKIASLPDEEKVALKPGHWNSVRCELKANNFDFVGDLQISCVGAKASPLELEATPFQLRNSRPVSLVKGQTRKADLPLFVVPHRRSDNNPIPDPLGSRSLRINPVLNSRNLSRLSDFGAYPVTRLLPHQFFLVVLAANPDRYGFLKATTVVRPPVQDFDLVGGTPLNYLVVTPKSDKDLGIPESALMWTTTAHVIWDGLDPQVLSRAQQTALLDWIHWGGRLVVAGPKSLEKLRLGFLQDYLPAKAGATTEASSLQISELNDYWSIDPTQPKPERAYQLSFDPKSPLQLRSLELVSQARFIPHTGQLVAERRVGRGCIVLTAFPLDDRRLVNWAGFESFLNNCLLGRPARRFSGGRDNLGTVEWNEIVGATQDPQYSSSLRYFTRDAASTSLRDRRDQSDRASRVLPTSVRLRAAGQLAADSGYRSSPSGGVAAWDDFSSASIAARRALVGAAGISVPDGQFVLRLLAVYLFCLVPVNWLLFRVLNRVEWAWVVAPVIAILGALSVIKLAQLDIGFVRSRTEIAVVETQAGYPRAHVTRYAGLYSSLTTRYEFEFDDVDGVALPFSADPTQDELRLAPRTLVEFRQQKHNLLTGMPIFSNSTGMVHTEQMLDMGGTVRLLNDDIDTAQAAQLQNDSDVDLKSAMLVFQRNGRFQICPVGKLERNSTMTVPLRQFTDDELNEFLEREPATQSIERRGKVTLRRLIELALDARQLEDGDFRLVGWSTENLDGLTIRPRASQRSTHVVWVHQIRYGYGRDPVPDVNLFEDVKGSYEDLFSDPVEVP